MNSTLLNLYKALTADHAILYAVRKGKTLVTLQASAESPELSRGQSFGPFEPTEEEQAMIDLVCPPVQPKTDPMANRIRKSEVERPVQYVLRQVRENPTLDRKALIALCVSHGVADYTARTQVQVGLKRRKALAALVAQAAAEAAAQPDEQGEEQSEENADSQEG